MDNEKLFMDFRPIISAELVSHEKENSMGELVTEKIWKCKYLNSTPDEEIERLNMMFPDPNLWEEVAE